MGLSSDLISQFVKATNDAAKTKTETTVYGTIVEYSGSTYVKIDGSDLLTPISTTVDVKHGERVTVMIKNHTATITGNISSPAARTDDVKEIAKAAVTNVCVLYAPSDSSSAPPSSSTVWTAIVPDLTDGEYMWQKTVTTYGDGSIEESPPTCLSGMAGKDGEDATVLRIDSSRGTVFKNSSVSTVLSVVIYHGSQRITDKVGLTAVFGSGAYLEWSWQRMEESTFGVISSDDSRITNDGFCFALSPDDVDTKVVFQCSLNI